MLSRNRPASTPAEQSVPPEPTSASGSGKGRPTPKRKEAEAARRKPLVPADRKAAAKAARAASRAAREREHQALQTGDDRFLPPRDKGPVRRFVRDHVDARRNLGEFFLPASIVVVVALMFTGQNAVASIVVIVVLYTYVAAMVLDAILLGRKLRQRLTDKFGEVQRGAVMYGVLRAFQLRRTRLPRTQVKRGEFPV
ncbi:MULTISPECIES: DUF3043 domain-containing protein [unclassified Actinotalea]|uniref:DUF3043 domain-containing protein n=1 Tax=unclassified Actinotalea TaxID=2638618 RepID=UPI0015F7416E|nr:MULTISPECIES: DUF3043 domain-containing protein [unclassified Actinotalea]